MKSKALLEALMASGAMQLSGPEICHLIFEPGFTPAAHRTNVS
jgi:chemotaxis protein histidine kinase CheA